MMAVRLIASLLLIATVVNAVSVTLSNVSPRRDVNGVIMDAHDSKLFYFADTKLYYWYAASYGECTEPTGNTGCANMTIGACGFQTNHNVTLFTSPDLSHWTNEGVVFQAEHSGLPANSVLFAPKTIYHASSGTFVLWFNYIVNSFSKSYYAVATSSTATGPFRLMNLQVNTLQFDDVGDFNLLTDEDGTGYIIYTSISHNHAMSIEQLSDDYLETKGATASSGLFGDDNCEAPMIFRRDNIYYAVFGTTCCYCEGGSPVNVYTASKPLGPFTKRSSLGQLHSQSTELFLYFDDQNATQVMYIGDHWQSAPDRVKAHDYTVWAPLLFSSDGLTVKTAGFEDTFTISVGVATTDLA